MRYAHPGQPGAVVSFKSAYGNFIDGRFVEPLSGEFFMNTSPVDGSNIAQFPRSDARDIDFALDAAIARRRRGVKPQCNSAPGCCYRSPIVLNSIWNIWRWRRAGTMGNRSAKP
ncbi:lactaldehyde dehydrogenase [Klebsiella pneumoniae]|uniref:Lactaldehyde dehydrogenase n=1 Tax=Klebsiella pneumoniae TaxID=573 RepID=A0A377U105_KLEPN|nr:lactaldehyde dehydrogenase [Klebsiella pneumoniae]